MIKLILIFAVSWLIFSFLKRLIKPKEKPNDPAKKGGRMLCCSICDVYVQEHEAIIKDGRIYCSEEHSQQD